MSNPEYSAFQRHLLHFATPTSPPRLTLRSAINGSLAIGLNFPLSVLLSIALRLMYTPFPYLSPISVDAIPRSNHRTQLERVPLSKPEYTRQDLLDLLQEERRGRNGQGVMAEAMNTGHIVGFWLMAADARTHRVAKEDVARFQGGNWEERVVARRKGRRDVLPFWRGGPLGVGPHSWAVKKLMGVKVYENNDKRL